MSRNHFEKASLGLFPTPMYRLPNISRELGTNIWIKRDDLCGVALGGNKVRKLEYLLQDAKAKGYDLVMTTGQAQSNHAMLTAACALRMGLDCILVLKKRGVTARKGNQILNHLMGVEVRYMDTDSYEDIYAEMDRIGEALGRKVYKIPCGGSNALGIRIVGSNFDVSISTNEIVPLYSVNAPWNDFIAIFSVRLISVPFLTNLIFHTYNWPVPFGIKH